MKLRLLLFSVLVMPLICSDTIVWAADVTLIPGINFRLKYDDNIEFKYENTDDTGDDDTEDKTDDKQDDLIYAVEPMLTYDYATEINRLKAEAIISAVNFIENDNYNTIYQIYKLEGDSKLTELFTLSADLRYTKDSTLDSLLEETGRVTERDDEQRYNLNGGFFLNVTELIRVGGEYRYRQTDFGSELNEDTNDDTVSFVYSQRLKNQLDSLSLRTSYAFRELRTHETNTYRMMLGWTRDFSETFSIHAFLGGRYTEQFTFNSNSERTKNESGGYLADLRFYKLTDNMRTELRYHHDQVYEVNGGAREIDKFIIGLDRNLTERLALGIDFTATFSRDVDKKDTDNSQYYETIPKIVYNLTENHRLGLYYSFQYSYDDSVRVKDADNNDYEVSKDKYRNMVWLDLTFFFPQKM